MATAATMTQEEFHASKDWKSLTEGQKRWVSVFIETQDAKRATAEAYGSDDEAYVVMFTRKIETSANVISALDAYYRRSEKERFLRDLRMNIANSEGIAKVEGQKLLARILGFDTPAVDCGTFTEPPVCKVGDSVLVDGVRHRVTVVDANGKPTDGEPL